MKQKQFRLTDDQAEKLKEAAKAQGCTETSIIRNFIDSLGSATQDTQLATQSYTPQSIEDSPVVKLLREDLERERAQVAKLENERDEFKRALFLAIDNQHRTLWQRLKTKLLG